MILQKAVKVLFFSLFLLIGTGILYLGVIPITRPFKDENGNVLLNSIAILEELDINGMNQWISIRGKDRSNPILLWLHGGPGSAQMSMAHYLDKEIEEEFVVVHWDQRGAGKSNPKSFCEDTMTLKQFKDDALYLINYLMESLGQDKIYLLGHSWGTQIGIELVNEFPDLFHGYISVSQVVDHVRAVEIACDWLKDEMTKAGDQKGLEKLLDLNKPHYYHSEYRKFAEMAISYGGNYDKSFIELALIAFKAPEYTFIDYFRFLDGMMRGGRPLHKDGIMAQYNYTEMIPKVEVPVYFFIGRNDYNTPYKLVEEYYNKIQAPAKKLVVFEYSAHTPFISESKKFNKELVEILK